MARQIPLSPRSLVYQQRTTRRYDGFVELCKDLAYKRMGIVNIVVFGTAGNNLLGSHRYKAYPGWVD